MREMKDSGIEWIGKIPHDWELRRIKTNFDIVAGATPKSGEASFWDGGIPWITPADYTTEGVYVSAGHKSITEDGLNSCATSLIPEGSIIFSKRAPVGLVAINKIPLCTNQGCLSCVPKADVDEKYFYYVMSIYGDQFNLFASGTTFKEISADAFANFKLPYPDYMTQKRISFFLDAKCAEIDALIAAKEKTNVLLRERRQSIIYEAVTKGLDPNASMKDSRVEWIGAIPNDWKTCRIKHLTDKSHPYPVGDGDHGLIKADDYLEEGIPYIRVLNLTWGTGLNLDSLVYISDEMNDRIKNSELKPNDILIAKTGATIGKTAIVPASLPVSNTTSHVGKITISPENDAKFYFYVMTSFIVQKQIIDLSSMQSTRPELGIEGLKNLIVTLPPIEIQQRITEYLNCCCDDIDSMIRANEAIVKGLKEFRKSVIYEAVTGKSEV